MLSGAPRYISARRMSLETSLNGSKKPDALRAAAVERPVPHTAHGHRAAAAIERRYGAAGRFFSDSVGAVVVAWRRRASTLKSRLHLSQAGRYPARRDRITAARATWSRIAPWVDRPWCRERRQGQREAPVVPKAAGDRCARTPHTSHVPSDLLRASSVCLCCGTRSWRTSTDAPGRGPWLFVSDGADEFTPRGCFCLRLSGKGWVDVRSAREPSRAWVRGSSAATVTRSS
jgi:hypothetical protein